MLTDSVVLDGFGEDVDDAVEKYFDHFNIDASGVDLPLERFEHPIALRIFCTVTNPSGETRVRLIGRAPALNDMFGGYLADAANRIEALTNSRIGATDVHKALRALGVEMWNTNSREVSETRAKELFGDTDRRWHDNILNALQGEGVLIRQTAQELDEENDGVETPGVADGRDGLVVTVVYDLFAGHIVATAMAETGGSEFATTLSTPEVEAKFTGEAAGVHPLAIDIFNALVFVTSPTRPGSTLGVRRRHPSRRCAPPDDRTRTGRRQRRHRRGLGAEPDQACRPGRPSGRGSGPCAQFRTTRSTRSSPTHPSVGERRRPRPHLDRVAP